MVYLKTVSDNTANPKYLTDFTVDINPVTYYLTHNEKRALKFLEDCGVTLKIKKLTQVVPKGEKNKLTYIFKYLVELKKEGIKETFEFYSSATDHSISHVETSETIAYAFLTGLESYPHEDLEDFCSAYDYNPTSSRSIKIFDAIYSEYNKVQRLFTPLQIEILHLL